MNRREFIKLLVQMKSLTGVSGGHCRGFAEPLRETDMEEWL